MKIVNDGLTIEINGDALYIHFPKEFVVSALEKQIPKKPEPHRVEAEKIKIGNTHFGKGTTAYKCPACGEWISITHAYCYKCGQALDWSVQK